MCSERNKPLPARPAPGSERVTHNLAPLYNADSRLLILGSLPGPASRRAGCYYAHKQNIFWPLLAGLLGKDEPPPHAEARRAFALAHGIALWDVLAAAEITGAADSSIRRAEVNDLRPLLAAAPIRAIFTVGRAAQRYYAQFSQPQTGRTALYVPSTSPANRAAQQKPEFLAAWRQILDYL
jgi:hypoxanthine-DNA glycosylase